jgi:hypothetical protein
MEKRGLIGLEEMMSDTGREERMEIRREQVLLSHER